MAKNHLMIDRSMQLRANEMRAAGDRYYATVGDALVEEKLFSYYTAASAIDDAVKKRIRARKKALESARQRARRKKLGLPTRREQAIKRQSVMHRVPKSMQARPRKGYGPSSAQRRGESVRDAYIRVFGRARFRERCKNPKWVRNIHDNMIIELGRRRR